MSTSIKRALLKINTQEVQGFFLILGDQPLINPSILFKMILAFTPGKKKIVVPFYKDKRGNPVLFDIYWKDELMAVTGDVGGRVLIKAHPERVKRFKISDESILLDIDWEEDYEKMKNIFDSLHKRGKI
jgi:molybdenum cofactor cytidylyltransferase